LEYCQFLILQPPINGNSNIVQMAKPKDFLRLVILVGIVGIVIGGITFYLSLTSLVKP